MLEREVAEGDETEQSLLAEFPSDVEGSGDCRLIVESWLARARQQGGADRHIQQLWAGCHVLNSIRSACWSNRFAEDEGPKRIPQTLWAWPHDDALVVRPKEWMEASPADLDELDSALAEYLKRPWLRHDTIDVSVINALIFTELAIFVEEVKTGRAIGAINWSYLFSGGNIFAQMGLSLVLPIIGFFLAWVMWPAISWGLAVYGYETAAKVTISIWGLYVLYRIVFIPARFRLRKARKTAAAKAKDTLTAATKAWYAARGRVVNPSQLRDLILAVERHGGAFRPVLHTFIDRAIQRDPAVMTRP